MRYFTRTYPKPIIKHSVDNSFQMFNLADLHLILIYCEKTIYL